MNTPMVDRPALSRALRLAPPVSLAMLFVFAAALRAWVSDDAYLTFRTIDNVAHGLGLRWNPLERVQVYTHPLWMLCMTAVHSMTGEFFYSSIVLSLVLSAAAVALVGFRLAWTPEQATLGLAALFVSRAFLDYATSGLENALTHLLLVLLFWACWRDESPTAGDLLRLTLVAALLATTRLDLMLLVGPLLVRRLASRPTRTTLRVAALGALPLVAWEMFSLFYYGFLLPNPAYAKLDTALPRLELIRHGLEYLVSSLRLDPPTLPVIAAGVVLAFRTRRVEERAAALGIGLYLFYVVWVGGDFMNGRFLTAPLLVAVILIGRSSLAPRVSLGLAGAIVFLFTLLPWTSPFRPQAAYAAGVEFPMVDDAGIADERAAYEGIASLSNAPPTGPWPNPHAHDWAARIRSHWTDHTWIPYLKGPGIVDEDEFWPFLPPGPPAESRYRPVVLQGMVGILGFYIGPEIHILDYLALGDPLLARLPALRQDPLMAVLGPRFSRLKFRAGHYTRRIPLGYFETLTKGENHIRDPDLAAYYDHLAFITRGPLWDRARLAEIMKLNLGRYDELLRRGAARESARRDAAR